MRFTKEIKCECGKKLTVHGDQIGILNHRVIGMRENINDVAERLLKLEEHVYPPKRRLQGHKK